MIDIDLIYGLIVLTLEQLRIFVTVAEREHVTAAARELNLTQSAVSNAVAALEARHGLKLFDRVGRGISLNGVGRAFLPEAKAVLSRARAAEASLTDLAGLKRGRLAVFASQTIASYWLPTRLTAFHARHPGIELDVSVGNTREAAKAVLDGEAEIGLVEGDVEDQALVQQVVGSDQLALIAPPEHPWSGLQALTRESLIASPWVLREAGSGTRSSLETALAAVGVQPRDLQIAMTLPSNEAVLAAVEAGAGATALSLSVAQAAVTAGRLRIAPFQLAPRDYRLLRHRERYWTRAGDAFVDAIV